MDNDKKKVKGLWAPKILFVMGVLCTIYFAAVCIALGTSNIFNYFWMFASGACFMSARYWIHMKCYSPVAKIIGTLAIVGVISIFVLVEAFIISGTFAEPDQGADYAIVLGAKVNGEEPSKRLLGRLEAALTYLEANPETKVIVSGGQGEDEGISEAMAMARFFKKNHIDEARIIMEDKSTNTVENLKFSKELINSETAKVVIVSSGFHVSRAKEIAKDLGYGNISILPDEFNDDFALLPHYYMREFFSVIYYLIYM